MNNLLKMLSCTIQERTGLRERGKKQNTITVSNMGEPIPEEARDLVFERFIALIRQDTGKKTGTVPGWVLRL